MPAVSGITFVLQVNTGTDISPVYTTLAGGRSATLNLTTEEIDTTTKDDGGWHTGLPGIRGWSVDFDGLLFETDGTYDILRNCMLNGTQLKIQMQTPQLKKFTGKGTLTTLTLDAPHDDAAGASGSFTGTAALAYA